MKKRTLYLLIFLWVSALVSACNSTPAKKAENNILSITISSGSGSIPPQYRTSRFMEIKKDLSTYFEIRDYKGKITKEQRGKITQAQFNDLVVSIKTIDLAKIKSTKLSPPRVGGGRSVTTIKTDKGEYSYTSSDRYDYPKAIDVLSGKIRHL